VPGAKTYKASRFRGSLKNSIHSQPMIKVGYVTVVKVNQSAWTHRSNGRFSAYISPMTVDQHKIKHALAIGFY